MHAAGRRSPRAATRRWAIRAARPRSASPRRSARSAPDVGEAQVLKDWDLYSSVASCSAGIELMHNVVILVGNSRFSASPFRIGHAVMKDAIDLPAVMRALESVGLERARSAVAGPARQHFRQGRGLPRRRHSRLPPHDARRFRHQRHPPRPRGGRRADRRRSREPARSMSRAAPSTRAPPAAARSRSSRGYKTRRQSALLTPRLDARSFGERSQPRSRRPGGAHGKSAARGRAAYRPAGGAQRRPPARPSYVAARRSPRTKVARRSRPKSLAIPGLVIDGSKMQEAGDGLPKHCIVTGEVNDRTGVDGKHYAIRFEMRLPVDWNGRFLRSGQRRRRRRGRAGDGRPAEGARFRRRSGAGARLCGAVVRQRTFGRRSGQQGARPRRRRGLRPRSAGPARLRLFGRHDARADRQGDHRRPLRPQARLFLHVRLLERRTPHNGGGDADAGSL